MQLRMPAALLLWARRNKGEPENPRQKQGETLRMNGL